MYSPSSKQQTNLQEFICNDWQSPPNIHMMQKKINKSFLHCTKCKAKRNHNSKRELMYCCWCAGVISQQQNGAAQSPSSEPGSVSEWATDSWSPGSQSSTVGPRILLPLHPLDFFPSVSPFLSSQHRCSLSLSALFPFNQIQAKTYRAIYRRVVLF